MCVFMCVYVSVPSLNIVYSDPDPDPDPAGDTDADGLHFT